VTLFSDFSIKKESEKEVVCSEQETKRNKGIVCVREKVRMRKGEKS